MPVPFVAPTVAGQATNIVPGNNAYSGNTQDNPLSETSAVTVLGNEAMFSDTNGYAAVATASPTLTAAQMVNGQIDLTTQSSGSTVTTDTAANIVALIPNLQVGSSFDFTIRNIWTGSNWATLAGGTGVTFSGANIVPNGTSQTFKGIVTNATAGSYAITLYSVQTIALPDAFYSTAALQSASISASVFAGARIIHFENTGTTPGNLATPTAAQIIATIPNAFVGQSYTLFIRNSSGSANTATITAGDGNVTLSGTMTIAQNVTRMFNVTVSTLTTVTIRSMGIFAAGA